MLGVYVNSVGPGLKDIVDAVVDFARSSGLSVVGEKERIHILKPSYLGSKRIGDEEVIQVTRNEVGDPVVYVYNIELVERGEKLRKVLSNESIYV